MLFRATGRLRNAEGLSVHRRTSTLNDDRSENNDFYRDRQAKSSLRVLKIDEKKQPNFEQNCITLLGY
jgi:hypothetical protein